jgi:hypothetical protein
VRRALAAALLAAACAPSPRPAASPQDEFWAGLTALCGKAFEGRIAAKVGGGKGPDPFEGKRLVMHARECRASEIRVPFHVGEDRSRTWVFTRPGGGLRLKHDHRHEDGSDDAMTMYGGDAAGPGEPGRQSFPADAHSKELFTRGGIPQSAENVWVVGLAPGKTFSYALTRPGREFRVEFDLTRPVEPPSAPWGAR